MSLPLTSLQAKLEAKEQMKLEFKRNANAERNGRFLNARQRVIGVDVEALDRQVWEKQMSHQNDRELARIESKKYYFCYSKTLYPLIKFIIVTFCRIKAFRT